MFAVLYPPTAVCIVRMYGAAVIWHGRSGHGQLARVPLGVIYVIQTAFLGVRSDKGIM